MTKRIVYTRHDGGVTICRPSGEYMRALCNGGHEIWARAPRGFADAQVERMIVRGVNADAAARYARAATFGGCTTSEALEIIRDRDCAHLGTAIDLWDADDEPSDRWYRSAWRRSHNGGPISIDLKLARPIQWKRARSAVEVENKRRSDEFDRLPLVEVDWERFRERICRATDEIELRQIWPL